MSQLKTLKDLPSVRIINKEGIDLFKEGEAVSQEVLRQEVIKHIKAFDDLENNPELKKFHGNEEECWIKWFFNITEEELQ